MSKNPILYGVVLLLAWLGFSPALQARFEMQDGRYDVDLSLSSATVRTFTSALTRQTGILFCMRRTWPTKRWARSPSTRSRSASRKS